MEHIKKIVPFVINSNVCTSAEDIETYDSFMDCIAGNTGNSYITWSLLKEIGCTLESIKGHHIRCIYNYDFDCVEKDIDIMNNECTHVILILQDQIRIHESYGYKLPYDGIKRMISKIRKPILIAGLGANSLEGYVPNFHKGLSSDLVNFLKYISDRTTLIGIRGYYTQEVLHNLGIDNTMVIGCPSYYETGRNRVIEKPVWSEDLLVGTSTGIVYSKYSSCIYLQDAQPFEGKQIKWIVYGKKSANSPRMLKKIENKQIKVFSSIVDWKEDVSQCDFYVGGRVHGSMVALNSFVPTVVICGDSRSREMCEYLNIPYHPEFRKESDLFKILQACEYEKMNKEYNSKLDDFILFLRTNGYDYNLIKETAGEISLQLYGNGTDVELFDYIKSYCLYLPKAICKKIL